MFSIYCYQSDWIASFWAVEMNSKNTRIVQIIMKLCKVFLSMYMFSPQKHSEGPLTLPEIGNIGK